MAHGAKQVADELKTNSFHLKWSVEVEFAFNFFEGFGREAAGRVVVGFNFALIGGALCFEFVTVLGGGQLKLSTTESDLLAQMPSPGILFFEGGSGEEDVARFV